MTSPRLKICAVILARMNSVRFPGKSVAKIGDIPMIEFIIQRLKGWAALNDITVILSVEDSNADKQIIEIASAFGIEVHNGHGNSPKHRINEILTHNDFNYFFRINGDSPLIDVDLLDYGLTLLKALVASSNPPDIISNIYRRTFPYGISLELCNAERFKEDFNEYDLMHDEHVFQHIYLHASEYLIYGIEIEGQSLEVEMFSVDTESDMMHMNHLLNDQIEGVSAINFDWKVQYGLNKEMFIARKGNK